MNTIQIFSVIILVTHEVLCQKESRYLYPHTNQFYENIIVPEPLRRVPDNGPRFDFSFDGIISSLTAPFRKTFLPTKEFPPIKRYSEPAPQAELVDYDYEDLMEKRKQDFTNNNRFKSDIMMLIAKKKHEDMRQELHPHHYYSTKVKVQDADEVDRDDDFGNEDTADEDWRWPHKVTYRKDNPRVEVMEKVFDVAPALSAGGVKVSYFSLIILNL